MPLKFEIDRDAHAELPEATQALYAPHGDKFRLQVEGIDPADELKEALRKEREQSAAAKAEARRMQAEREAAERDAQEKRGEFQQLYQAEQARAGELAAQLEQLRTDVANRAREAAARQVIGTLTTDPKRAALLMHQALPNIAYTPEGVKINGPDGAALTAEQLAAHLTAEFPFLVDGSKATGGGASGNQSGGAATKRFDQYTSAELSEIHRNNPAEYERLRSAFHGAK